MAAAVDIDNVPVARRPKAVAAALDDAQQLRTRLLDAQAQVKKAEAVLEQQERRDVELAAQRIRTGEAPGNLSPAISKARHEVELATRNRNALALAAEAALVDAASVIREHGDDWAAALDGARERASTEALSALDTFEQAIAALRGSVSARNWLDNALQTGRFDAPPRMPMLTSEAPSSARVAANSRPFDAGQIVEWARELIEPPPPQQRMVLRSRSAAVDAA